MRIIHINTVCSGSTGSIASDIAAAARLAGHTCFLAYGQGRATDPGAFRIGSVAENKLHALLFSRILGLQGYGTQAGTWRLLRWMDRIKPDVVHLHNLHGNFLNHPMLFRYLTMHRIPVVITLHDCYHFTGKCAHFEAAGCYKWRTACGDCPLLRKTIAPSYFFDRSAKIYRDKKAWIGRLDSLHVVAVSKWLEHQAAQSLLAGNGHRIGTIYNWVDRTVFRRASKERMEQTARKYGLSPEKRYVISVGAGWRKDSTKYRDAKRLAAILPEGYELLLVGQTAKGSQIEAPIRHIPYVSDREELAALYSLAAVYVHLSVEDTFGKVIAEAMACGTPPIVFDATACPEIAGGFGCVVSPHDVGAIVARLPELNLTEQQRRQMTAFVEEHFDQAANTQAYISLYQEIVS